MQSVASFLQLSASFLSLNERPFESVSAIVLWRHDDAILVGNIWQNYKAPVQSPEARIPPITRAVSRDPDRKKCFQLSVVASGTPTPQFGCADKDLCR